MELSQPVLPDDHPVVRVLIRTANAALGAFASKPRAWHVDEHAPETFAELLSRVLVRGEWQSIPVRAGTDPGVPFTPHTQELLRAWHDATHINLHLAGCYHGRDAQEVDPFSLPGERMTVLAQATNILQYSAYGHRAVDSAAAAGRMAELQAIACLCLDSDLALAYGLAYPGKFNPDHARLLRARLDAADREILVGLRHGPVRDIARWSWLCALYQFNLTNDLLPAFHFNR